MGFRRSKHEATARSRGALRARPRGNRTRRPFAVEVPEWQREQAPAAIASLIDHGRGGYPDPGYPPELLRAHLAARVTPLHREVLARAFLRQLASERPELQQRLVEAHLTGQTLVIEPSSRESPE